MKLKPIKWIAPYKCDVLIYDDIGANWLWQAVPTTASVGYLSTRFAFPVIGTLRFCTRLLLLVISYIFHHRRSIFVDYLSILVDEIKPKAIITGEDNNSALSLISESRPDIRVVFVQTAMRDTVQGFPKGIKLPHYYAFGDTERKIFQTIGVTCEQYLPVGSVKLGIALAIENPNVFPQSDICFVSNHRSEADPAKFSSLDRRLSSIGETIFRFTSKYAQQHGFTLRVLAKSREPQWQDKEYAYYTSLANGCPFDFVRADKQSREFATYQALFNSQTIVHVGSTLGFEAISLGKQCLFAAPMDPNLMAHWGVAHYYEELPDLVCLTENSYEHFARKLAGIRNIPPNEYLELIHSASHNTIRTNKSNYPHEIIRMNLQQFLECRTDHSTPRGL